MLNSNSLLAHLFAAPMCPGRVVWIGVRPARGENLTVTPSVIAETGRGLIGDRYKSARNGPRQVTLIQAEHLAAIASFLQRDDLDPRLLRRNIVVEGINLLAMKGRQFMVGQALLECTGECHPCSRMEENLGPGAYNAVRGHGGITARVIEGGEIRVGDSVYRVDVRQDLPGE
jgi:MOSC domain-containing protein YiiM